MDSIFSSKTFLLPLQPNDGCYPKEKERRVAAHIINHLKIKVMEIIGRLTADAKVNETRDGRQVVNFSIATNDNYKVKETGELKKVTTYFNCSYWINSNVAKALSKGTLVELYGRISVNTYINTAGETKASLQFHVNNIKLHGKPTTQQTGKLISMAATDNKMAATENENEGDDLPF